MTASDFKAVCYKTLGLYICISHLDSLGIILQSHLIQTRTHDVGAAVPLVMCTIGMVFGLLLFAFNKGTSGRSDTADHFLTIEKIQLIVFSTIGISVLSKSLPSLVMILLTKPLHTSVGRVAYYSGYKLGQTDLSDLVFTSAETAIGAFLVLWPRQLTNLIRLTSRESIPPSDPYL